MQPGVARGARRPPMLSWLTSAFMTDSSGAAQRGRPQSGMRRRQPEPAHRALPPGGAGGLVYCAGKQALAHQELR